jgi:hypothetical protein
MVVEFAIGVFDQDVEQVDRHDEKCDYHECDERAGAEVDAGLRVVDFVAGAGFEGVFLWDILGGEHVRRRLCVRASRRYAVEEVSVLPLEASGGLRSVTHIQKRKWLV